MMKLTARVTVSLLSVLALQLAQARPHKSGAVSGSEFRHADHHNNHLQSSMDALEERQNYCGTKLAEALKNLCRGEYNWFQNRSGSSASGLIVRDCCHNRCLLSELSQYCLPRSEPSTTERTPLDEAHLENHIRPVGSEDEEDQNETTYRPRTQMPSVVGGRNTGKWNLTQLQAPREEMVKIGTVSSPRRTPVPIPVHRRHHAKSNAL